MSGLASDVMFTAMCLWEEIVQPVNFESSQPWQAHREHHGSNQLREMVLGLAAACWQDYLRAGELFERAHNDWDASRRDADAQDRAFTQPQPSDPGALDYEFVPFWLRNAVDWTDVEMGPRLRGSRHA